MLPRSLRSLLVCLSLSAGAAYSGIITINFDSGGSTINDQLGSPLSGGTPTVDGDGFVLQLGYYSQATTASNFLGEWVALSGFGSLNTGSIPGTTIGFNQTTVGDNQDQGAGAAGTFALTLTFDESDSTRNKSFPAVGVPLSVRFYNASTLVENVTLFNAFSIDTGFNWAAPADSPGQPILNISLDQPVEWQSGGGNAGKTALVFVPEPSSVLVFVAGVVGLCVHRRRRPIA